MKLLTPLGLLGLIAIAILIIIYIIRPNYQQKFISSTYVWKLSLKYKKKRIPTSKLRNILLIVSQILILAGSSAILAQPNLVKEKPLDATEVIAIIDSSASMRTSVGGETRFERAVNGVKDLAENVLTNDGIVTVILAGDKPEFLAQRCVNTPENQASLNASLNKLIEDTVADGVKTLCSYGSADMDAAVTLCEEVLRQNPNAVVKIFTDTEYEKLPKGIQVERELVVKGEEWNAGILDAYATVVDNYYSFHVDVARYGNVDTAETIQLTLEVVGANALDSNSVGLALPPFVVDVPCIDGVTQEVVFIYWEQYRQLVDSNWEPTRNALYDVVFNDGTMYYTINKDSNKIYSYQSILVSIDVQDSFREDDSFNIYNGQKEVIKVQYASSLQNSFVSGALGVVQKAYRKLNLWDIQITTVHQEKAPATEGFDFYIFEHKAPQVMPEDGVVFLINPSQGPENAGFKVTMPNPDHDFARESVPLTQANDHPILKNITTEKITVSRYRRIESYDGEYIPLMECNSDPILLVKDVDNRKVALLNFSLHYSNIAILGDFPTLVFNMFEYFIPSTIKSNAFAVNENVQLNARGDSLTVSYNGGKVAEFTEKAADGQSDAVTFPVAMSLALPGTYELSQTTAFGKEVKEKVFVQIPSSESDIWRKDDTLPDLYREDNSEKMLEDLMFYIAAGMLLFLFIEWWLQSLDTM